jgi:Family of unknown function (DUF6440)
MNKKILSIFMVGILSISVLTGCSEFLGESVSGEQENTQENREEGTYSNKEFTVHGIDKHTFVMIHKETNVQYLKVVRNAGFDGGVTVIPLYQASGKPYVGSEVKQNRFSTKKIDKHTFIITDKETKVQYLKVVRNAGYDGGVTITPLINAEGGLFISKEK